MNTLQHRLSDRLFLAGLAIIGLALIFFCLPFFQQSTAGIAQDSMGMAMMVYLLVVVYFVMVLGSGRLKKGNDGLAPFLLFLILFMISSFALNRELNVFESSVPWTSTLLCITALIVTMMCIRDSLPLWLLNLLLLLLGVGFALLLYFAFYLLPMYLIAGVAFFVLGLSLHVFAPLLWVIFTLKLVLQLRKNHRKSTLFFSAGFLLALLFAFVFILRWNQLNKEVNLQYRMAGIEQAEGLPAWMTVARSLPQNDFAEKIMKADLVYTSYQSNDFFFNWSLPSRSFDEPLKHDPLIFLATLFVGKPSITEEERIKILKLSFDARHQAEERLWSGNHLATEKIYTHVDLWPHYGLAYTEKELVVTNNEQVRGNWKNRQEALYTFYLPEGAVVSSLSLWVNGKEEKARLTSKGKADSAYKQIVGVEQRDPSVIHWKEGNRTVLRVFPVLSGESRKVKIGITSPLKRNTTLLEYRQIAFRGPDFSNAREEVKLQLHQNTESLEVSHELDFNSKRGLKEGNYMGWEDAYKEDWSIQFKASSSDSVGFQFNGYQYQLQPLQTQNFKSVQGSYIYLDLNASWSKDEFNTVLELLKGRKLYVHLNKLQMITNENKDELFRELSLRKFSLFPFQVIKHPEQSLLISKSNGTGPEMEELKDSRFYEATQEAKNMHLLQVWHLGTTPSPYLNTLKEYRYFNWQGGTINELATSVQTNRFPVYREDEQQVMLPNTGWMIRRSKANDSLKTGNAPDHLMRLFYYNWILMDHGSSLKKQSAKTEALVARAEQAHVVSPVSSLVVLETAEDYKRFGIGENKDGLGNASKASKGAVPEPHEWALIALIGLFVIVMGRSSRFNKLKA